MGNNGGTNPTGENEKQKESPDLLTSRQIVMHVALKRVRLKEEAFELLKERVRMLHVRIPVRMDDGSVKIFSGFRAQHNDSVGPTIGGIRFHPMINENEVKALAMWMSLKCGI